MHLKIDWASLILGNKFTVFALFNCVFEGNFPSTSDLTEGFLRYRLGGLTFREAYFLDFTVFLFIFKTPLKTG